MRISDCSSYVFFADLFGFVLIASLLLLASYFFLVFFADQQRVSCRWPLPAYLPLLALLPAVLADWRVHWRRAAWATLSLGTVAALGSLAVISVPAARSQLASGNAYPENLDRKSTRPNSSH